MSLAKLKKFLDRPSPAISRQQTSIPVLLSDSKGKRIEDAITSNKHNIEFWCKKGLNADDEIHWLRRNLRHKLRDYDSVHFLLWLGTCDITQRDGKYIKLRNQDGDTDEITDEIINKYRTIITETKKFNHTAITIFEVPVYSISRYNQDRGHPNPDEFINQDATLLEIIQVLNEKIRDLNRELGWSENVSPRFTIDLEARKKRNKKYVKYYNYSLFADGLHPSEILATVWFKRIEERVYNLCY